MTSQVGQVVGVDAYEQRLDAYLQDRSEEARAVRVGEKETSEQAAIVARYADLFTREQLEVLRDAEDRAAEAADREAVARLRLACQEGIVMRELAEREDVLENALLAARVPWDGEELPLRSASAQLALEPDYGRRDALGAVVLDVSSAFNDDRRALLGDRNELESDVTGIADPVERNQDEKGVALRPIADAVGTARVESTPSYEASRERWLDRLLGEGRDATPSNAHVAWIRRLSPLAATYTKERSVPVCVATLRGMGFALDAEPGIRTDLEDRPQKSPRACVIASDPPRVVHLITRAQGGLHDYEAFLHEAGHALHYAGCDPALPLSFRRLSRDHALTEIYSFLLDSVSHRPAWHAEHFGLSDAEAKENADAAQFTNILLFRRYTAKLGFELDFWTRFTSDGGTPDGYEERLTAATGIRYPAANYLSDMDAGFYSADYLRAWIRSAQLRAHLRREVGHDWWRQAATGDLLRELFRQGTRPTTEDVAAQIGYDPLDTGPLVADLAR